MLTRIDHVGLAVRDLDAAIAFHERVFGLRLVHTEENEEQGVREAMLEVGNSGSYVQLLTPLRADPPSRSSWSAAVRAFNRSPTRSTTSRRRLNRCEMRACDCFTTNPNRAPQGPESTSCIPRTPAVCWSNWSSQPVEESGDKAAIGRRRVARIAAAGAGCVAAGTGVTHTSIHPAGDSRKGNDDGHRRQVTYVFRPQRR